jgi:hypothetical protein
MENKMTKTQLITLRITLALVLLGTPTLFVVAYFAEYVWSK